MVGGDCEPESEMKVSDNFDRYFSDQSDAETIDPVAPDELLDNSARLGTFYMLILMLEANQLLNLWRKVFLSFYLKYLQPLREEYT